MKILLITLFVTASSATAREAVSPNARLRGTLTAVAVGVPLESDSLGAGGEEGRFETGTPEFLSCVQDYNGACETDGDCCSNNWLCEIHRANLRATQCWGVITRIFLS